MIANSTTFDPDIFNPLFHHIVKYLSDENIRYIYIYGGSSAAKTYSIMQALSLESYRLKYNCYVMRKYSNNIKDTIYSDFKGFNNKLKQKFDDITIIQNEIRSNRNLIRFKGIDDSEKLKGLSGFKKVFLDEITEFVYDDLKQVRKRLRGSTGQQVLLTWNPVSEHHWIKKRVLDLENWYHLPKIIGNNPRTQLSENSFVKINEKKNAILIKTTYLDNWWVVGNPFNPDAGFVDKHVIADFESDKINDENNYRIYALGEWGVPSEGLYFKKDKHWFTYSQLPDIEFYEVFGLDFGGGSSENDEPDGKSKTVFLRVLINKATMSVYVETILYKGHISHADLEKICFDYTGNKLLILADNARRDKIQDMLNSGLNVIGAKTKEGGSNQVVTGYDFMKKYKIFVHENDIAAQTELNNHKEAVNQATKEPTGQPEDKYKDWLDALRYALVNYHLFGW